MKVEATPLEGVMLLTPQVFGDDRGFFMETFNSAKTADKGIPEFFAQDNHSRSSMGVLRGLHFQQPQWQGKLVRAIAGEIFDVAVDIRDGSKTFGQWFGVFLNSDNKQQLYVPPGFAHGFCVTSDVADVAYKCTSDYQPTQETSIRWNDPEIGIKWPIEDPLLSDKDKIAPLLSEVNLSEIDFSEINISSL
jgi:dTDP-4-dehydrorhamnose 3,5-epimerase